MNEFGLAGDVVSALCRAGVTDVDASSRRRAEYSTDASLYRVVPRVVVFPRAPDEIGAIVEVGRTLGVPLTARGGWHVDRRKRGGHGDRARLLLPSPPHPGHRH